MNRNFLTLALSLISLASAPLQAAYEYYGGTSRQSTLGNLASRDVQGSALLYKDTVHYFVNTTQTSDANSGIFITFSLAGGCGYVLDFYQNDVRIGTTSVYEAAFSGGSWISNFGNTVTYHGYYTQLADGNWAGVLPLTGLPAGSYSVIVARSGLNGTNSPYTLSFRFPGSGSGTGGSSGGTYTGPIRVGQDAGPEGELPAKEVDGISYSSPVQAKVYSSTPEMKVTVVKSSMDLLKVRLYQLNRYGERTGIVNWQTGDVGDASRDGDAAGYRLDRSWEYGTTGSFSLPRPALPPGNYQLVTEGYFYSYWGDLIWWWTGSVSFRIEPPSLNASNQPALADSIQFDSPTDGASFAATPELRGRVDAAGVEKLSSFLFRIGTDGRADGVVDWSTGAVAELSQETVVAGANTVTWNKQTGTFTLPKPALAPARYAVLTIGSANNLQVAEAIATFTITRRSGGGGGTANLAGFYSGIVAPASSSNTWGQADIKVSAAGRFTGKLNFLGFVTPLKGVLVEGQTQTFTSITGDRIEITPRFSEGAIEVRYVSDDYEATGRLSANRYHVRLNPAPVSGSAVLEATKITQYSGSTRPAGAMRTNLRVSKAGRFTYVGRILGEAFSVAGFVQPDGEGFAFARFSRQHHDLLLGNGGTLGVNPATGGLAAAIEVDWVSNTERRARQYSEGFWVTVDFASGN